MKLPLLILSLAVYAAASVIERAPLPLITEAPTARAVSVEKRQAASLTATVTLSSDIGAPSHLASGFIYGIPDVAGQIPDSFYTGMGFNFARAGGAQVAAPGRGWIWGLTEYKNRFASVLSNYKTARKYNAQFIFLIHDLWGADGTQNSSAPYPGDNGDWTSWDAYLTQWIADITANNMTPGLIVDIWNEPDLTIFWNRAQSQWLQMYGRTWHRLRTAFPSTPLYGPTLANSPLSTNTWWTSYLSFVKSNASIPNVYVWHLEGSTTDVNNDLQTNVGNLNTLLSSAGLPTNPKINIDEYGNSAEQVSSGSAWWIARLERYNAAGLRGNWLGGTQLHDFMASLLGKTNVNSATGTGYYANGQYQVYKYYATSMTGYRVATSGSTDRLLDVYATIGTDKLRVLCGVRLEIGTWELTLQGLSAIGLANSGSVNIQTYGFPDTGVFGEVDAPTNLGIVAHTYSGNLVTFPIYQVDTTTAYAFEITVV